MKQKTINLMGARIRVKRKKLKALGQFDQKSLTVTIAKRVKGDAYWNVLAHELGHAAQWLTGGRLHEASADAFGAAFVSLVRDNPKLVKAIQKG